MTRKERYEAAIKAIKDSGGVPRQRYHHDAHQVTSCQAWEDGCDYEFCPRWRGNELIDERHCALDYCPEEEV